MMHPPPPQVYTISFNPLGENTYIVTDGTSACVIIDPGCYSPQEQEQLREFISRKGVKPLMVINTHCHFDHIFGVRFATKHYAIPWVVHSEDQYLLKSAAHYTAAFGFELEEPPAPDRFASELEPLRFGQASFQVLHVPGHTKGSICLYSPEGGFVIVGDVLFDGSIGRTDLPGGDYQTLIRSIKEKLMTLPGETTVYPGHGPATSIQKEKSTNPFLQD